MKARITLCLCAALWCVAALANAAEPVAQSAVMSPATPAICSASLSALNLPDSAPQFSLLSRGDCGACSASGCQNTPIGTGCFIGNKNGTCQNVYGDICTGGGGINKCQCWNGPLP